MLLSRDSLSPCKQFVPPIFLPTRTRFYDEHIYTSLSLSLSVCVCVCMDECMYVELARAKESERETNSSINDTQRHAVIELIK